MDKDTYKEIKKSSEAIFKDRGSKFIAVSFKVYNRKEVEEKLEEVKNKYHDARHHCYAYMIKNDDIEEKMNDDGEPSGSAGRPILGQIKSAELLNVLVVVVRYFGGTKLGVSGLINAYKTSTQECLKRSGVLLKTIHEYYSLKYEYPLMGDVMHLVNKHGVEMVETNFKISCELIIKIRKKEAGNMISKFHKLHKLKVDYIKDAT